MTADAGTHALPRTTKVLQQGIDDGTHLGAQLAVSVDGKPFAELAIGIARPGVPMTTDSMMIWFSSTKASTSVAAMTQWEKGAFDLDDPVARHIPEFGVNGKERITIRHLLTHTAGIRFADRAPDAGDAAAAAGGFAGSWDEITERICAAAPEPGWEPGKKAGYHPTAGMHMLGELVRRADGRPFGQYLREVLFEPLGMTDAWVGMPGDRYEAYGDRIGMMHNTQGPEPRTLPFMDSAELTARTIPGGNGRGPMHDLVKLYEMLLGRGQRDGVRILSPQTVDAMTARHRVGMFDETFGAPLDWGLGLMIDAVSTGRYSSPRVFGHGGAQSSIAFGDPEHGVAAAYVCNGMPEHQRHYRRMQEVSTALYLDLGIAKEGDPPRERVMPKLGLG